jgi:hypothetical protein
LGEGNRILAATLIFSVIRNKIYYAAKPFVSVAMRRAIRKRAYWKLVTERDTVSVVFSDAAHMVGCFLVDLLQSGRNPSLADYRAF